MRRTAFRTAGVLYTVALGVLLGVPVARANPCTSAARHDFPDCLATCIEQFQAAKDACFNRDHTCVEDCRAQREVCREATGLDAALAACDATRDAAIQACKDQNPPGPDRGRCIDQVQVVAFQCRDQAREDASGALGACRDSFKTCALGCAPAAVPLNVAQCRRAARLAFKGCRARCREDFQIGLDNCRNHDHDCVEDCRARRAACVDGVGLDEAIAVCNGARDAAIQTCQATYSPGPDLDQCIDNAQVDAFRCRDTAREDTRPALGACRDDFQTCARACPPPASPSGAFLDRE